ncbi:MAG: TlyA family RNA methyltransferase [Verrucomicrobia bacterium]|nr:TlyA family RNA methyltransferase [Verrucomicrobiota bacterium]
MPSSTPPKCSSSSSWCKRRSPTTTSFSTPSATPTSARASRPSETDRGSSGGFCFPGSTDCVLTGGVPRLDIVLVERGLCESRTKAQRLIMAGQVTVNARPARKPGDRVGPADDVALLGRPRYVSRGGEKLDHALRHFGIAVAGLTAVDLGASTGGFTDCLLQHGAARVYAVDVGRGQLAWTLRQDPRVIVMEGVNARWLAPGSFPAPFAPLDLAVSDCAFISLRKILPAAVALLKPAGRIVALVKPQFEAGKAAADRGRGVIADPAVRQAVLHDLRAFVAARLPLRWQGVTESPLRGPAGNMEFLVLLEKVA